MTTTDTTTTGTPLSIPALRTSIAGRVIAPDDAEYDRARTVMYGGGPDDRPAVIVKVANVDDVVRVVALARETGLELAVRSGGHSARRPQRGRRRDRPRPRGHEGDRHRRRWPHGVGRVRADRRGAEPGARRARPGPRLRRHGFGRDRRDHPRRRGRLPRAQVRIDHRRPDRRRDRDRRRHLPPGRCRTRARPVLGDPRRRRELRRRDPVPLPRPRGRAGPGWPAHPAGDRRRRWPASSPRPRRHPRSSGRSPT